MPKWGMVIDLDKCTACGACITACHSENNVAPQSQDEAEKGRLTLWIRLIPFLKEEYLHTKVRLMPVMCQHCDKPPCTKVCPVGATYRDPEGIVGQIYARCIGCRYCTNNCPYTIKAFNWKAPSWPGDMGKAINPDVSVRSKGVVEKCTLCHHRLQKAREQARVEGRPLKQGDYIPACVEVCPAQAMYFGDLSDPHSQVSELERSPRSFRLMEDIGTHPKVIYLTEV